MLRLYFLSIAHCICPSNRVAFNTFCHPVPSSMKANHRAVALGPEFLVLTNLCSFSMSKKTSHGPTATNRPLRAASQRGVAKPMCSNWRKGFNGHALMIIVDPTHIQPIGPEPPLDVCCISINQTSLKTNRCLYFGLLVSWTTRTSCKTCTV